MLYSILDVKGFKERLVDFTLRKVGGLQKVVKIKDDALIHKVRLRIPSNSC